MEDIGQFVVILIFIAIQGLVAWIKKSKSDEANAAVDLSAAAAPPSQRPRHPAPRSPQRIADELGRVEARLEALAARLKGQRGARARLMKPVEGSLRAQLEQARAQLMKRTRRAQVDEHARRLQIQVSALEAFTRWQEHPKIGPVMVSAERAIEELLEPLRRFAHHRGLEFPSEAPLCGPEGGEYRQALSALFPGHPILLTPSGFNEDPRAWAALGFEAGRIITEALPEIVDNLHEGVPGYGEVAWLPRVQGQQIYFGVEAAVHHWMPELLVDAFAALLLGPAALRGAIFAYDRSDAHHARSRDGHVLSTRPPGALRIMAMRRLLGKLGFEAELRHEGLSWEAPELLEVQSAGGPRLALDPELFMAPIEALYARLLSEDSPLLAGHPIGAVHGLKMTIGGWRQVEELSRALQRGEIRRGGPRAQMTAAIIGAYRAPEKRGVIRDALVGALAKRKAASALPAARSPLRLDDPRRELRDALILRSVLWRERR